MWTSTEKRLNKVIFTLHSRLGCCQVLCTSVWLRRWLLKRNSQARRLHDASSIQGLSAMENRLWLFKYIALILIRNFRLLAANLFELLLHTIYFGITFLRVTIHLYSLYLKLVIKFY